MYTLHALLLLSPESCLRRVVPACQSLHVSPHACDLLFVSMGVHALFDRSTWHICIASGIPRASTTCSVPRRFPFHALCVPRRDAVLYLCTLHLLFVWPCNVVSPVVSLFPCTQGLVCASRRAPYLSSFLLQFFDAGASPSPHQSSRPQHFQPNELCLLCEPVCDVIVNLAVGQ